MQKIMRSKMSYNERQKRKYFRVHYPPGDRPKLVLVGNEFEVIDLSERGMRFYLGTKIHGVITFHNGESVPIEGKIIRIQNGEVAVHLSQCIPSDRIIEEQKDIPD